MRADAARNNRRIFEEARQAVAAGETDLTLNALARRAGVGVGTVYRLFPTQRAMLEAVVEDAVAELHRLAAEAEREPDPRGALDGFLRAALDEAPARPGLFTVLIALDDERESLRQAKAELVGATSRLLARAHPQPPLTGENLLKLLCGLIHAVSEHPADRRSAATDAYLSLLRNGLMPAGAA
ncbi:TetR/AcrR family transcriptional regulator [Nocardiopsis synnemataformans]|uniref:TetR/AcrR family transcriptional regulator n=1 Tax=Nocardiopsis synnemataformans TaxID=61305 RepID=UPI003EB99449